MSSSPVNESKRTNESEPPYGSPVSTSVEVVNNEYLTLDEEKELLRLERIVERSFYEAGQSLRQIREKKLYRASYTTFEDYCRERFGFQRRHSYQLIDAAIVIDNLLMIEPVANEFPTTTKMCATRAQNQIAKDELSTPEQLIDLTPTVPVPTNEYQVRPLTSLTPSQQREAWTAAVALAKGKVPSNRIVNHVVRQIQENSKKLTELSLAHHLKLNPLGVVEMNAPTNPKIHQHLGRIASVRTHTVEVWVRDVGKMVVYKYTLKHHQVEPIPLEHKPVIKKIVERLERLRQLPLNPFEQEVLCLLDRVVALIPGEEEYLSFLEAKYLKN